MVKSCCICKIELGSIPDVSIHSIPKNEDLKAKWFINIGREVSKNSGVCSQHFESKFIHYKVVGEKVKRFLIPEAVPTLLLTQSKSHNVCRSNIDSDSGATLVHKEVSYLSESANQSNTKSNILPSMLTDVTNASALVRAQANIKHNEQENIVKDTLTEKQNLIHQYIDDGEQNNIPSENISNSENEDNSVTSSKTSLKRKSEEYQENKKRFHSSRFLGDLRRDDFTNENSWIIVKKHVVECRKKQKVLNQKVHRLNTKIGSLKSLLDHLKKIGLITNEGLNALDVSD